MTNVIAKRREHVLQHATSVFGRNNALAWMSIEMLALGRVTPTSLLETEAGYCAVINALDKLDYEFSPLHF